MRSDGVDYEFLARFDLWRSTCKISVQLQAVKQKRERATLRRKSGTGAVPWYTAPVLSLAAFPKLECWVNCQLDGEKARHCRAWASPSAP